jgi:hypothetical protein
LAALFFSTVGPTSTLPIRLAAGLWARTYARQAFKVSLCS